MKFPSSIICPNCKKEIRIERDVEGILKTDDLLTMRIRTPLYTVTGKITEVHLDISISSPCNTIVGLIRKM